MRSLMLVGALFLSAPAFLCGQSPAAADKLRTIVGNEDFEKLTPRLEALNKDILTKGLRDFPGTSDKLLTGYAYGEFYDWDLYFENVYLSYYGVSKYNFTNFKMFLDQQKPDGFVSRTLKYPKQTQMFKPFLAQIAVLGSKQNGDDYSWLRDKYYGRLQKYLTRWFAYDTDGNGLPVWDSSDASGMDNQTSRAGEIGAFTDEGVDLACYLYRELQAMQVIATKLGKKSDAAMYKRQAAQLAVTINKVFWDSKDGFYYDRNEKTGKQVHVKSVAGFMPIWAGIASPQQTNRLVHEHLLNPDEFWLKYPVATYAKTEPDFYQGRKKTECNWHGPAWVPTNYMIFHGLIQYGYTDAAHQLAVKTFQMALDENPVTREFYDSDTGKGNGMNPFWGWSSLAYIMPLDLVEHYDPMDLHGTIRPLLTKDLNITFSSPEAPSK